MNQLGFDWENPGINTTHPGIKNTSKNQTARQLQDRAIRKVSAKYQEFLDEMRKVAREIFHTKGKVSSEDLRKHCARNEIAIPHPNVMGAVFREPGCWRTIGFIKSEIPSTHARIVAEWIWIGEKL